MGSGHVFVNSPLLVSYPDPNLYGHETMSGTGHPMLLLTENLHDFMNPDACLIDTSVCSLVPSPSPFLDLQFAVEEQKQGMRSGNEAN